MKGNYGLLKKIVTTLAVIVLATAMTPMTAYAATDDNLITIECSEDETEVLADADGTVSVSNQGIVTIAYDNAPIVSTYSKLDAVRVANNQHVEAGDVIAVESKEFNYKKELIGATTAINLGPTTNLVAVKETVQEKIADYACEFVGNPYVWGGTSLTNGADCSGFVQTLFGEFGITTPRTADVQYYESIHIDEEDLRKGDLVFYGSSVDDITHVAIYLGDGRIVHAKGRDYGIVISDDYKYNNVVGYGRYELEE